MIRRNRKGRFTKKREPQATWLGKICLGGMLLGTVALIASDAYREAAKPVLYEAQASSVVEEKEVKIKTQITWTDERIEQEIREVFSENPNTMIAIAKCENAWSEERGYVADQQSQHVLSYGQEQSFGIFQVHAIDWHETAIELGLENYKTDPGENILMAKYIYDVQGITAWTCFNKNLYQKYL